MQKHLILYGTAGCHLCENAERILQSLGLPYETLDIIDDNCLLEKFEVSIPVLESLTRSGNYLYWPFDKSQLIAWLNGEINR